MQRIVGIRMSGKPFSSLAPLRVFMEVQVEKNCRLLTEV